MSDPRIYGTAAGGLVAGLVILIFGETWKQRIAQSKWKKDYKLARLDQVYGPLYKFYREAYGHFEVFKNENPQTLTERQAFFQNGNEEFAEQIINQKASHASQKLIEQWTTLRTADNKDKQRNARATLVSTIITEYQSLRRETGLDYNKIELRSGKFVW